MLEAILGMDGAILLAIQSLRTELLNGIVAFYTHLGDTGMMWIVLSLLLLCSKKTRKAGFWSLIAMLMGMVCTNMVLKHLIGRTRPWVDVAGLVALVNEPDPNSFPSGHTCAAFAAAVVWLRLLPWRWGRVTAVVLAVLMGLSRLYVGVHYPTDVLAGALVGTLCALAALKLRDHWRRNTLSPQHFD